MPTSESNGAHRSDGCLPRRFAVVQEKGGVGKTTVAVNVAVGLAATGCRTLLVDLDPQGAASRHVGFRDDGGLAVLDVIAGRAGLHRPEGADLDGALDVLFATHSVPSATRAVAEVDGLWLAPATRALLGPDRTLRDALWLRRALAALPPNEYDVVLIDTAPRFGPLTVSALAAAGGVLAPTELKPLSFPGLERVVEDIAAVRRRFNDELDAQPWIVPTRVRRTRSDASCASDLEGWYPGRVLPAIRENVRIAEAPAFGMSIYRYDPTSAGALDFSMLTGVLTRRLTAPARAAASAGSTNRPARRDVSSYTLH